LVAGVEKNGPADKGGLEPGDVIIKFDGKSIVTSGDLPRAVGATKPGKIVAIEVIRKGSNKTLSVGIGEMPNEAVAEVAPGKPVPPKPEVNRLGLTLKEATPQQKKKLGGKNGLVVIEAVGPVAQAGIRRGDVVLGLNNTEVQSLEQFNKQLASFAAGKTLALLVLRGDSTLYVPVKVPAAK
jgi:serine protease Do